MKQGKIIEILLSLQEHVLKIKDDVSDIQKKMVTKVKFKKVTDTLLTEEAFYTATDAMMMPVRGRAAKLKKVGFKK